MTRKSVFQMEILEKLAAPLVTAGGGDAQRVAELLGASVRAGLALAGPVNGEAGGEQADAVRLAAAALCAPLVGDYCSRAGKAPDEAAVKNLVSGLEAVLVFSGNFTAGAENTLRLQGLEPGLFPPDKSQATLQYAAALMPVAAVVAAHSFGRQGPELMRTIAERLNTRAAALRMGFAPDIKEAQEIRLGELRLLGPLARLYANCHDAEAARQGSLDNVWKAFDRQAEMLAALATGVSAPPADTGSRSHAPASTQKAPNPPVTAAPATGAAAAAPPPAEGGSYNPMSFFKPGTKKAEATDESKEGSS